jgi:hypothetical protein
VLLLQAALGLLEPIGPRTRDRPRLLGAAFVKAALGLTQPAAPALRGRQLARQLVAARRAEPLVLSGVDRVGLGEDLAGNLLIAARRVLRRVRVHVRAVDHPHPHPHRPRLGAQREHLTEQAGQRRLVALTKARDRRVVGPLVRADHARGVVLGAAPLDPPRRPLTDRVDVEQQRHHHRRIVRRPTMTVGAIGRIKCGQIHLRDRVDHKPRQMVLRQPLAQARRQQQLLLAITRDEVLRHPGILLTDPDRPHFVQQPQGVCESESNVGGTRPVRPE